MGYEGHLLALPEPAEKARQIHAALEHWSTRKHAISWPACRADCFVRGTGSYRYAIEHPGITEIQAGGAIFMDVFYRHKCQVPDLGYALTVWRPSSAGPRPSGRSSTPDAKR